MIWNRRTICWLEKRFGKKIFFDFGHNFFAILNKTINLWNYIICKNKFPRLRSRPKLSSDQTQSSAHPCVPRPKLQGLFGSSSALRSGTRSGDGLIRGHFGLKSLIIGGFERTWVWSEATSSAIGSDHNLFERTFVWSEATSSAIGSDHNLIERTWVWSEMLLNAIGSDQGPFRAHFFSHFF